MTFVEEQRLQGLRRAKSGGRLRAGLIVCKYLVACVETSAMLPSNFDAYKDECWTCLSLGPETVAGLVIMMLE